MHLGDRLVDRARWRWSLVLEILNKIERYIGSWNHDNQDLFESVLSKFVPRSSIGDLVGERQK